MQPRTILPPWIGKLGVAIAAVVVLDFVATWLLKKVAGAAGKVGAKLKRLAEKFNPSARQIVNHKDRPPKMGARDSG